MWRWLFLTGVPGSVLVQVLVSCLGGSSCCCDIQHPIAGVAIHCVGACLVLLSHIPKVLLQDGVSVAWLANVKGKMCALIYGFLYLDCKIAWKPISVPVTVCVNRMERRCHRAGTGYKKRRDDKYSGFHAKEIALVDRLHRLHPRL